MPSKRFIHVGPVEQTYAHALLALAEQAGQVDATAAEMAELAALVAGQEGLRTLLGSRVLSVPKRADSLARLFQGKVSDLMWRFLMVLNRKGRLDLLPAIARAFAMRVQAKHGVVEVEAYVPAAMDDARAARVTAELGKALGRTAVMHQHVDPALLGGLKIRVGDQLIDGTAAAQLRLIRRRLIEAGRDKARAQAQSI
jgi:F-type H+-transporting ATPase subunit delta